MWPRLVLHPVGSSVFRKLDGKKVQRVCIFRQRFCRWVLSVWDYFPLCCWVTGSPLTQHGYTLTHKQWGDPHINTARRDPRAPGVLHLFDLHPAGSCDPSARGLNERVSILLLKGRHCLRHGTSCLGWYLCGYQFREPAGTLFSVLTATSELMDRMCQRPECPRRAAEVASTRTSFCKWLSGQIYRPAPVQWSISGPAPSEPGNKGNNWNQQIQLVRERNSSLFGSLHPFVSSNDGVFFW